MHKRVCGDKSAPFRWPRLDPAELIEGKQLGTATMELKARPGRPAVTYTWLEGFDDSHSWPKDRETQEKKWEVSSFL